MPLKKIGGFCGKIIASATIKARSTLTSQAMHSHEPKNYICPFCKLINKQNDAINTIEHIVFEDENTIAYISPKWWPNNPGHVLVVPKKHFENIYDISEETFGLVCKTAKKMAIA